MVRSWNGHVNAAGVPEQSSNSMSNRCSIAQIDVMSNRPPCKGPLLIVTFLRHSLLNTPAGDLRDIKRGRPVC
jgi:hypothetical protein